ncbi:hypothetical protein D3C85_1271350 [compost metagenome]
MARARSAEFTSARTLANCLFMFSSVESLARQRATTASRSGAQSARLTWLAVLEAPDWLPVLNGSTGAGLALDSPAICRATVAASW